VKTQRDLSPPATRLLPLLAVGLLLTASRPALAQRGGTPRGPAELAPQFRQDLSVTLNGSPLGCHRVTYTVTLSPSPDLDRDGLVRIPHETVLVRVIDSVSGVPQTVGESYLSMSLAGESITETLEFPAPPDAVVGIGVLYNELTVVVDPDNRIQERTKSNNSAAIRLRCVPEPDLVVRSFQTLGSATCNRQGDFELPVRVVIQNRGHAPAGIFRIAVATNLGDEEGLPFAVPGLPGAEVPMTTGPLPPNGILTLDGKVTIRATFGGLQIPLAVTADISDTVEELSEYNNRVEISVQLPATCDPRGLPPPR
jgi:hypothetical protein